MAQALTKTCDHCGKPTGESDLALFVDRGRKRFAFDVHADVACSSRYLTAVALDAIADVVPQPEPEPEPEPQPEPEAATPEP